MATNYPGAIDELENPSIDPDDPSYEDTLSHAAQHANANDALEALEAKVGKDSSEVTTSHDYKLSGVTGTDKAVSKTGTETLTNKTLTSPVVDTPTMRNWDGWISCNETWAYASATTITVPTNATTKYTVGDKIRWKQGGAYKYGTVSVVAATLLTITGTAVTDATITDNYYSKANSPVGMNKQGVLGYAQVTDSQESITTIVDLTGLSVTVTVPEGGGKVRITGKSLCLTSVVAKSFVLYVREGTTILNTGIIQTAVASASHSITVEAIVTPTAGSHTYKLSGQSGGTATMLAAASYPAYILVEYIG